MNKATDRFVPADFFVLRTPLLPLDELQAWSAGLTAPTAIAQPETLAAALAADRTLLQQRLRARYAQPAIGEALFIASPDLYSGLAQWHQDPASARGQKVESALVRYFARMAGRATPFGLFSGCAVGTMADQTQLAIDERTTYQRHTRLDMDYLFALTETLGRDPALQPSLTYRPNSSLYRAGGRLRFAEARLNGKARSYHLVAVEETPYLNTILTHARNGAAPAALATALVAETPEIPLTAAADFVQELIAGQLLVADLAPNVSGAEPIHHLIAQLRTHVATAPLAARLADVRTALARIDAAGLGVAPAQYTAIADQLTTLPAETTLARLFQVDMVKPAPAATLGKALLAEIADGVGVLHRLFAPAEDGLSEFRQAFAARYEAREVPLVEVLDSEIGLGFGVSNGPDAPAPLLHGLSFTATYGAPTTPWGAHQALLLDKLAATLQRGEQTMALTPADLALFGETVRLPLPNAFAAVASVAAASQAALDAGAFQLFLHTVAGPSGARVLGRFCHADGALHGHVVQHLRAEEALEPDALFAEIIHLPEGRIGNVLCRPVLRPYEIPFLGHSGADAEHQLPITDLLVKLVDGQIVLRSQRLGRRIIPRLTSAHNYTGRGLALYKFLGMLQNQGVAGGLSWSWGPLESAAFLPRVTYGKLVLARARWRVDAQMIAQIGKAQGTARFVAVQQWRTTRQLPRYILLADGDNELPVDLDNVLSVESFIDLIKGRKQLQVIEQFPAPEELCAYGPEGHFVHELIVPFVQQHAVATPLGESTTTAAAAETPRIQRSFVPGAEWLYVKLYTGAATADRVLRELVAPLCTTAMQSGAVDQWFFLRYGDPDWHLRLRLHGAAAQLYGEVLPALYTMAAPLLTDGCLWRVQLDTYERELDRYGGAAGILPSEALFHRDSEAALGLISWLTGDAGAELRWRFALRGLDQLLSDFGFDLPAKHTLIQQLRDGFAQEFRVDKQVRRQIGEKYRAERATLAPFLHPAYDAGSALAPGFQLLQRRSAQLQPVIAALQAHERAGHLTLAAVVPSYLHMYVNRLLPTAQRAQELVLYEFLTRHYQAQIAQAHGGSLSS